jgi:hypothetical protein
MLTPGGGGTMTVGTTFSGTGSQSELQPAAQRQIRAAPATGIFLTLVTDRFPTVSKSSC